MIEMRRLIRALAIFRMFNLNSELGWFFFDAEKTVCFMSIEPKFGSWAGYFLTQRRRGAEKTVCFMFFESYFTFCNTIQSTPNG